MRMQFTTALVAATLAASSMMASAQTPAAAPGAGAGATVGSDAKGTDINTTTGMSNTQQGVTPKSPTGAPVPNAATSKPPADAAAPAGR